MYAIGLILFIDLEIVLKRDRCRI